MEKKLIGRVGVDSGQLMIIDPMNVDMIEKDSYFEDITELTSKENQGGSLPYKLGHEGLAVAFSSGFGDGKYDVYATYEDFGEGDTTDKRISKV